MGFFGVFCLLMSLLAVSVNSFQPNCETNNQFLFHCFPIEYCNKFGCYNSDCGRSMLTNSRIVRVKQTKIIPTCAFTYSEALRHISAVNSHIEVVASGAFVHLPNLDTINLSFNLIKQLHSGTFRNVSAKSLDLSWNKLVYIQAGAFEGLNSLVYLNLSRNELSTLPIHQVPLFLTELNLSYNLFQRILLSSNRMPSLTDIDLSHNMINKIALSFDNPLRKIDLSRNELSKFDFLDIPSCEELKLSQNRFSSVPEALTYLNVKNLSLYPNPWRCDELQYLWVLLQNNFVNLILDDTMKTNGGSRPICVASSEALIRYLDPDEDTRLCSSDEHCEEDEICRNRKCFDPCLKNLCDPSSDCKTIGHHSSCSCPHNQIRDQKEIYSPCQDVGCFSNTDCSPPMYCSTDHKCEHHTPYFPGSSFDNSSGGYNFPGGGQGGGGSAYGLPVAAKFPSDNGQEVSYLGEPPSAYEGGSFMQTFPKEEDMWWTYEIQKTTPTHKGKLS